MEGERLPARRGSVWSFAALATVGLGLLLDLSLLRPQQPLVGDTLTSIGEAMAQAAPTRLSVGPAQNIVILVRGAGPTLLAAVQPPRVVEPRAPRTPIYLRDRVLRL